MKTIAIGTIKGGVGKSMLAFNLAGVLAERGKVLLWDFDPQCNLSTNAGVNVIDPQLWTTQDVFETKALPEDAVLVHPIPEVPNLDVIPSSIRLHQTEHWLMNRAAREQLIEHYLEDHREFFRRYDWIIFDTNPSMSLVNQNAFLAADNIILVSDISDNAAQGVEQFQYMWEERLADLRRKTNIAALVVNNYDMRTNLSEELVEYYQTNIDLKNLLLKTVVPARVRFKETSLDHLPINILDPKSDGCEAILKVAAELEERGIV